LYTQRRGRNHQETELRLMRSIIQGQFPDDEKADHGDELDRQRSGDGPWPHRVAGGVDTGDTSPMSTPIMWLAVALPELIASAALAVPADSPSKSVRG